LHTPLKKKGSTSRRVPLSMSFAKREGRRSVTLKEDENCRWSLALKWVALTGTVHGCFWIQPGGVGMLKHVVMFKFKKSASESAVAEVEKALRELSGIIAEIKEFELGRDLLRSERSYDFALVSGFENLEKMKQYQIHPAHQKIVVKLKELCESILAVDFEN
jgi:hypothetical protein